MLCKKKRSLFLFLLVLILFSSYVYSEPLTETQDADCVDDFCTLTDYLYPVFPIDSTNNSRYVYDVFRITKNEDDLTFHYNGTNGMYNITFETGVFYNNNYYSMAQVKVLKPAINFNFPIQKEKIKLKYAVNITNIDTDLQANINNITLTYKSYEGFDIFQLIKNGKQYKIGVMNLLFDGLIESGFNIDIASDERRIYISNLRYDGNALYLGSNVQYHNGTLKNKYSYVVNNTIESSLAKLNAYPYLVKNNEIQDFTLSQKLNFNSSYKLAFKSKEDINVFVEYFNGSDWVKFDFNKSNGFYYTNTFIINGINSSSFRIKPTHKNLLYNDVFEYNISLISDDLILEYLELDPYVNVTGCREDEEAISCTGSLTGNYLLNTTKTINISHSTIDANDVNPTLLIINTTGKLSILNSSLNVNAPANSNNANLKILAQNMNISNSTIDASTANTASSVTMGSSTVLIDGGNITLGDNLRIYANAGNATGTGTTAAGSDSTFTLKSRGNITFKNNVWIMAYGTNTPSSGGSTYLGGGNSIFRVDAKNIDFGTNTHIYAHGGYDNNGGDDDGYSSFNINATQLIMKDAYIDTWGLGVESTNTNNMFFIAINNSEYPNSTIIYNTTLIGSNKFNVTSISQVNITDATLDFNQEDNGILNLYGITELFINNSNFQFNIGSPTINITANKVDINNLTLTMNSGATNTKINSISYPLNITNSFINMKASANSNNANLELKALSSDIFILPTSTIDASTANTASSVTMGSSTVLIDGGNITLGDNLRIYANAGNATGTGTTAAGSDSTFTLKSRGNITFKNNVWIMAYGTNTPSSGGSTYLGGGNSIFRVDAKNIDFGTNTHIYAHGGYDNNGGDDDGYSSFNINATQLIMKDAYIDTWGLGVESTNTNNMFFIAINNSEYPNSTIIYNTTLIGSNKFNVTSISQVNITDATLDFNQEDNGILNLYGITELFINNSNFQFNIGSPTINITANKVDINNLTLTMNSGATNTKINSISYPLNITNSFINMKASANSNNANLELKALSSDIFILPTSTIDASTANTASSVTMGSSTVLIDGGNITLGDNLRIYANAGNATGTGTTAAGSDSTFTLKSRGNITFKNNVWIMAYGTNTPSSGGSTYLGGGNSIFRVDAKNIDFGTNTHIYAHGGYDNNGGDDLGQSKTLINSTNRTIFRANTLIDLKGLGVETLSKFNLSAGNEIVFYNPVNVTLQSGTTNIINLSASENARLGIFNLDWLVSTTVQCTNGLTVGTSGRTDQAFTYSCTYTNITEAQYFAPTITTPIITPTTAYTTSKLNCSTIPSVEGGGNLNVSFWWFKNNDSMTNFDSNATCLSGDTCYVTKLYTTSLTAWNFSHFDNITCMAQANVSSASNKQNSSLKFINNSVPFFTYMYTSIVIIYISPIYPY